MQVMRCIWNMFRQLMLAEEDDIVDITDVFFEMNIEFSSILTIVFNISCVLLYIM